MLFMYEWQDVEAHEAYRDVKQRLDGLDTVWSKKMRAVDASGAAPDLESRLAIHADWMLCRGALVDQLNIFLDAARKPICAPYEVIQVH